ncbi:MAG TPA: PAS domain-containing protein [Vulgatibacter sp.]
MTLGGLLARREGKIVDRWVRKVRGTALPGSKPPEGLESRASKLIRQVAEVVRETSGASAREAPNVYDDLARRGYLSMPLVGDAQSVVREYVFLRDAIFEVAEEEGVEPKFGELRFLLDAIATRISADAAELAEGERELFFRTVPDMLCVVSFEGRFLQVNPAFHQALGWTDEEFLGTPLLDFVHPDDREATIRELENLAAGQFTLRFENRYRTRSGAYRLLSWAASPVVERGFMYAVARDVTERREAEHAREETLALLDSVVETAPVGLAFLDEEARYIRVNAKLAQMNGHPAAEHRGKKVRDVLPELAERLEPLVREVFRSGTATLDVEITLHRPDGTEEHRLLGIYPVRDARGQVFLAGTAVVDITERKKAMEALRHAAEFRERFVGIVAHDLRTPLASISTGAQVLARTDGVPERGIRVARRISSTAQRTAKMIADLMDFTRVRLGTGIPIEKAPADLGSIVRQVVDETDAVYPGRSVEVIAKGALSGCWDGDRLAQLVGNLLKNALDYSPSDTPVHVRLTREDATVRLEVINRNLNGPIPAVASTDFFEPFYKGVDRKGKREGLGLGLYIANEIVRAHGGTIELRSNDEGTCFTVCLPAEERRAAPP